MRYRPLGNSGLQSSEIALGCSGFWGNRLFDDRKAISVVMEAFENGINLFDTGHNYCNYNAEPRLGRALKQILSNVDRSRLIVSTKAGTLRPATFRTPHSRRQYTDYSPDYVEATCAKSIKNLQCGYLDIFQLHGIAAHQITDELLTRLEGMKKTGMYRYLGINTHRASDMIFVAQHPDIFDVALIDFNVLQLDRIPLISTLHAAGIGVLAGTVLGQGHLFEGKIGHLASMADVFYFARAKLRPEGRRLATCAQRMRSALCGAEHMTAPQAAVAFVLENPAVTACVVGTTRPQNLRELIGATGKQLSERSKAAIWRAFEAQGMTPSQ